MMRRNGLGRELRHGIVAALALWSAADVARGAAQSTPPAPTPPQVTAPTDPFSQGQQLFVLGRYPEAERAFALACERDARQPLNWAMLGRARQAQSLLPAAIEAFERADALSRDDARILGQLGSCHFDLQHLDIAAKLFQRVLAIQQANSRAHLYLARIAVARGDDASAEREFSASVSAPAVEPIAPFHQGLFLFQRRRLEEARVAFERALELIPDLEGAHMNLGLVLARLGRRDEAERHLARFRELHEQVTGEKEKKLRVAALLAIANDAIEAGNYEAALPSALAGRDLEPAWPLAHEMLARIYTALGRKDESARELETARTLAQKPAPKPEERR